MKNGRTTSKESAAENAFCSTWSDVNRIIWLLTVTIPQEGCTGIFSHPYHGIVRTVPICNNLGFFTPLASAIFGHFVPSL